MRKFIAVTVLALALAGSAVGPVGTAALAASDTFIDQTLTGDENYSNTFRTQDTNPASDPAPVSESKY